MRRPCGREIGAGSKVAFQASGSLQTQSQSSSVVALTKRELGFRKVDERGVNSGRLRQVEKLAHSRYASRLQGGSESSHERCVDEVLLRKFAKDHEAVVPSISRREKLEC